MIVGKFNEFKTNIINWFNNRTIRKYEKYLLNNKGKRCRFHVTKNQYGGYFLAFNADSRHSWKKYREFYLSDKDVIKYYSILFVKKDVEDFIKSHPMIDDILKDFEKDKLKIEKDIQSKKEYKEYYNLF